MAENSKAMENEYKPRNLWGLVMGLVNLAFVFHS